MRVSSRLGVAYGVLEIGVFGEGGGKKSMFRC